MKLKVQKVGNSLGIVLPKEALARLNATEGDTLVFTEEPGSGFRVTHDKEVFARQMAVAEDLAKRYQNAIRKLVE